jgi:hypothetical protein
MLFWSFACTGHPGSFAELQPHIGEYATKTNAISGYGHAPNRASKRGAVGFRIKLLGFLLTVIGQDLIAGLGELGTNLLQAVQNDEVGIVHHRAAKFLNVVSAGLLLLRRSAALLLLGDGPTGDRQR